VHQHEVEVAGGAQLTAAVAAHGDQSHTVAIGIAGADDSGQPAIGQVGVRPAELPAERSAFGDEL